MDVKALIERTHEVNKRIVTSNKEVIPCFFAEWGDGTIACYMTIWSSDEEKIKALQFLKVAFAARNVKQYVSVSESWRVTDASEDWKAGKMPSECSDREEVLQYCGVSEQGAGIMAFALLGKDGDNRTCGDLEFCDDAKVGGRMTELLSPEGAGSIIPDHIRDQLEELLGNPQIISGPTIH